MRIRPCIDIHDGKVKQIVGGSLRDKTPAVSERAEKAAVSREETQNKVPGARRQEQQSLSAGPEPTENFVSGQNAAYYAGIYREKNLPGGHIIMLNPASDEAAYRADRQQAMAALAAFPGGMQVGGGITPETAGAFLDQGASHVIVTSYVFREGKIDLDRLNALVRAVGKEHLVLDLSCRRTAPAMAAAGRTNAPGEEKEGTCRQNLQSRPGSGREEAVVSQGLAEYRVVTDRWQKMTEFVISEENLDWLSGYCDEFLIHAADVEGKRGGIEKDLVSILGKWQEKSGFPITYAGGVHSLQDLDLIRQLSDGRMDVTVGSALDLFGGNLSLDALSERAALRPGL